jgi:hypothetical protein
MELFARISLDAQDFEKGIKNAESGFKSFGSRLSSIGGKIVKGLSVATAAAAAGFVALGKNAVGAYAQYEQLVGGVETLFKDSAGKLQGYASEAYKTAGVSANKYMEMSTSFAASLVSGLGGDTSKAADMANMAIIDMSDNANKMGTDLTSIQTAYQGFAKQNYTMLDNLKLGYGGTKQEMERLLKDAEALTGKKYDVSNFADIVEAIHAIQTQMGITGTTATEASTTISGSINMVKAAWEDMLVAMANPQGGASTYKHAWGDMDLEAAATSKSVNVATKRLVDSVKTMLVNVMPAIHGFIDGFGLFLSEVAPIIGEEVPQLIAEFAPKFIEGGANLIKGLGKGIVKAAQEIQWPTWSDVQRGAVKAWEGIQKGVEFLGGLIFGKKQDGTVNWPTWDDVKAGAAKAWEIIKSGALTLGTEFGKIVFGTNEKGEVKWPDWDGVVSGAQAIWKTIVDTAKTIGTEFGKIIFGTNEKGEVNWPTWDGIVSGAKEVWNTIVTAASSLGTGLGKIVFGTNENGEVKWPTWDGIVSGAKDVWDKIVAAALSVGTELGKIIFGTTEDGAVKWPTWDGIVSGAKDIWGSIVTAASTIGTEFGKIIFGTTEDGGVNWPSWDGIVSGAQDVWNKIIAAATTLGTGLGKIVFGTTEDGGVNWPSWDSITTGASSVWQTIVDGAATLGTTLGKIIFGTTESGGVNWPSWDGVVEGARGIWQTIVAAAANLPTEFGKIIFGTTESGDVAWPKWSNITSTLGAIWEQIKGEAAQLKGLVFGDAESAGSVFENIRTSWNNLKTDITNGAINIATYFFDTANPHDVAVAITEIVGALERLGGAIAGYLIGKNLEKIFNTIRTFMTADFTGSKVGLILAGISAAIVAIYQNWDVIEPKLTAIGEWINASIISPMTEAIAAIQDFVKQVKLLFHLGDEPTLTAEQIQKIREQLYHDDRDQGIEPQKATGELAKAMQEAKYSDSEIAEAVYALQNNSYAWNQAFIEALGSSENVAAAVQAASKATGEEAKTAQGNVTELQKALDAIPKEYNIKINITTSTGGEQSEHLKGPTIIGEYDGVKRRGAPKAIGDWNVPYDNFPALLHRGEMVLTATQARQYRDGQAGGGLSADDVASIARAAVSDMALVFRDEVVARTFGDATTGRVNDNMTQTSRSHRYGYGG